ncbi:MAG: hypothetical protein WAO69_09100 [Aestuariivita sp.]|uniref:hypothetical protein n=1 Tax=Aestuariivita sp. TaxID=1872407 RepID=UPI003BAEB4F7
MGSDRRRWGGWTHVLAMFSLLWVVTGAPTAASERLPALRVVQSGHSLTDTILAPLTLMVRATSMRGGRLDKATIPGSPMEWRWNNATSPDIRQPAVMAEYDVLAITERVALTTTLEPHESKIWALRWAEHAWAAGARSVLYASWVNVESGPGFDNDNNDPEGHLPFRDRLPLEMARWESIQAYVNDNRSPDMPEMTMIPGPLIMARAYDEIAAGRAPGLSDIRDLFADDIHLNEMGSYLIALGHFAVIYGGDLLGLPQGVPARGGPDKAQAEWMQRLVREVLADYAAS